MAKTKKELIGQAPEGQIAAWKKIHKIDEIFAIEVDGHVCYIKPLDRAAMKYALSQINMPDDKGESTGMSAGKLVEIGEIALQNGWLGGSEAIKTNDRLFVSAAFQAGAMFDLAEVSLKKL